LAALKSIYRPACQSEWGTGYYRVSKWMGHRLLWRKSSCPEATAIHILDIPDTRVGFCLSTERRPGASSTRYRRFPGAKGTRLHSSSNVADEVTGP